MRVITDRDAFNRQIKRVMRYAGVVSADASSPRLTRRDKFVRRLGVPRPWADLRADLGEAHRHMETGRKRGNVVVVCRVNALKSKDMSINRLNAKTCIVTGAGRGIRAAIARAFPRA